MAGDATPADNMSTFASEVFGSFDPNDKLVHPATLTPAEVAADNQELTYTVRFQNTGTWPAVKVVVVDTLSPELQWASFRKIASSHPCTWELNDAGVLTFFDFNAPVRTLAAVFTVDDGSAVEEAMPAAVHVYPNPVRDLLWVKLNTREATTVQVFDAMGREHIRQVSTAGELIQVPLIGLASGPYSLRCTTDQGTWSTKFLKR